MSVTVTCRIVRFSVRTPVPTAFLVSIREQDGENLKASPKRLRRKRNIHSAPLRPLPKIKPFCSSSGIAFPRRAGRRGGRGARRRWRGGGPIESRLMYFNSPRIVRLTAGSSSAAVPLACGPPPGDGGWNGGGLDSKGRLTSTRPHDSWAAEMIREELKEGICQDRHFPFPVVIYFSALFSAS